MKGFEPPIIRNRCESRIHAAGIYARLTAEELVAKPDDEMPDYLVLGTAPEVPA